MLPHGLQKVFGLFGGTPLGESIAALSSAFGLPWVVSALVVAIELFGPIALVLGLFSRVAAAGIAGVMIGAVATVHGAHGFMMNWAGSASGEGYEYHILVTAIASVVIALGSGRLSLDRTLQRADGSVL
jgi:putative oxidoreductase